jgi:hypothetical protein
VIPGPVFCWESAGTDAVAALSKISAHHPSFACCRLLLAQFIGFSLFVNTK